MEIPNRPPPPSSGAGSLGYGGLAALQGADRRKDTQETKEFRQERLDIDKATLIGGDGDNLLDASAFGGQVVLLGRAGDDTLLGGVNDDTLDGGAGSDLMVGGGGNDTYVFDGDDLGNDVIDEQSVASDTSSDTLSFHSPP